MGRGVKMAGRKEMEERAAEEGKKVQICMRG
jgi:hypothetical protein